MTYDELYGYVVNYITMPRQTNDTIAEHNKRRACLILGAFMEFIMDCTDAGIDPHTLDLTGIVNEKLDELEAK